MNGDLACSDLLCVYGQKALALVELENVGVVHNKASNCAPLAQDAAER